MTARPSLPRMLLVLAVQLLPWLSIPTSSAAFKNVGRGDPPPAFTLKDLGGKEWKSGDLVGRGAAVIVFWSTWSPRSREVLADLEKLRAETGPDHPFQVIAVNAEHVEIGAADRAAVTAMVRELGLSAIVLLDEGLVAYNDYGAMALPSSLVVDAAGKVVYDLAGYPTTLRSDLADAVRKAVGLPTTEELRPPEPYVPKNHALMYYNFGRRLMEKGQDEKAEAQLLESVERDPDFVKPRLLLGIYYKREGRLEDALGQFTKVREIDPADREAGYQEAAVRLRAQDFTGAESLFGHLGEEYPEREEFALGLALALKYEGRGEESRAAMERAASIEAAVPRVIYEFGGVAEGQGDLPLAASLYRRALEGSIEKQW